MLTHAPGAWCWHSPGGRAAVAHVAACAAQRWRLAFIVRSMSERSHLANEVLRQDTSMSKRSHLADEVLT